MADIDKSIKQIYGVDTSDYLADVDTGSSDSKRLSLEDQANRKRARLNSQNFGNDSDTTIALKEAGNVVSDAWNAVNDYVPFVKDSTLDTGHFTANVNGRQVGMSNKIFEDADVSMEQSQLNREALINEYNAQEDNPNAEHKVYQLRLLDGIDAEGNKIYTYKTGIAKTSAADRYKDQWIANGYEILEEKGFDGAEDWENRWHGNKANIADRTYSYGKNDEGKAIKDSAQLQSGYTEVYNTKHFGQDVTDDQIVLNQVASEKLAAEGRDNSTGTTLGSIARIPQAALSGIGKSIYDIADTTVEVVGNIGGRIVGEFSPELGKILDSADIATETEKTKQVNALLGYDDKYTKNIMAKSGREYDKAVEDVDLFDPTTWGNIKGGALLDSVATALSTPEAAGYSLGYLAPALLGVFEKGTVRVMSEAGKETAKEVSEIAASKTLTKAQKAEAIREQTARLGTADKAKLVLADHADALGYGAMMTNDQLDEVIEANDGEQASLWKVGTMVALNAAGMKLDMKSAQTIIEGPGAIDGLVKTLSDMGKTKATRVMAKMSAYAAKLGAAGLTEMPQEFTQSFIEAFNKAYDVKQEDGTRLSATEALLSEDVRTDAAHGAIAGLAGGPHMAVLADVAKLPKTVKESIDRSNQEQDEQEFPETYTPAKEESTGSIYEDIDNTEDLVEADAKIKSYVTKMNNKELSPDEIQQLARAAKAFKEKRAIQKVNDGDVLGSTPEEEADIVDVYITMNEEDANTHRTKAETANPELVKKFKEVEELREAYVNLSGPGSGPGSVRSQVVIEGLDEDKAGFRTYFKEAIMAENSDERETAKAKLETFRESQVNKVERLETLKQEAESTIHNKVASIFEVTKDKGITEAMIVKAMLQSNNVLDLSKANSKQRTAYFNDAIKVLKALGKPIDNSTSRDDIVSMLSEFKITGTTEGKYASTKYSRTDGNRKPGHFIAKNHQSLIDVVEDYGVNDAVFSQNVTDKRDGIPKSQISEIITAIEREITSMNKAETLIAKRFSKTQTGTQEVESEVVEEEEVEIQKDETVQEELDEEVQTPPLTSAVKSWIEGQVTKGKTQEQLYAIIDNAKSTDSNKELAKAYVDQIIKAKPAVVTGLPFLDRLLAVSPNEGESIVTKALRKLQGLKPNNKAYIANKEVIEQHKEALAKALEEKKAFRKKSADTDRRKAAKAVEKEEQTLKTLQDNIDKVSAEINDLYEASSELWRLHNSKEVKAIRGKINNLKDKKAFKVAKLQEMFEAQEVLETKVDAANAELIKEARKVKAGMNKYMRDFTGGKYATATRLTDKDSIGKVTSEALELNDKAYKDLSTLEKFAGKLRASLVAFTKQVAEYVKSLTDIKKEIAENQEVIRSVARDRRVREAEIKAISKEIDALYAQISSATDPIKVTIIDQVGTRSIKEVKDEKNLKRDILVEARKDQVAKVKAAKEVAKGTAYTAEIILQGKKGSADTVDVKETKLDESGNPVTGYQGKVQTQSTGVKIPLDMSEVLTTSTPSTKIGDTELSDKDLQALGIDKTNIQENLVNSMLPKSGNVTDNMLGKYTYLMTLLNSDNTVNNNVVASMVVAVDNYIGENLSSLVQVTSKDIESFYGFTDFSTVPNKGNYLEGGIPRNLVVQRVAGGIMKSLGLKAKSVRDDEGNVTETNEELFEKISLGLANAAIQNAIDTGHLQIITVSNDNPEIAPTSTLKLAKDHLVDTTTVKSYTDSVIDRLGTYKDSLGLEKLDREVNTEPSGRDVSDVTIRGNSYTKAPVKAAEAVIKEENSVWRPNIPVLKGLLSLGESNLKKILGHKEADKDTAHEQKLSLEGKNQQIAMDIENVELLVDALDKGEVTDSVYFDWFISKNYRAMLDGKGGFNPQSIKLHRYSAYKDGMKGVVKPGTISEELYKLGIAQAFGYSIDKRSIEDSVRFADSFLNNPGSFEYVYSKMKKGESEFVMNFKDSEGNSVEVEIEEPAHTIQAVIEGKRYTPGKEFTTVMTLEVDGLTNGFAHKMLQYLITDDSASSTEVNADVFAWLEKVGIRVEDGETIGDVSDRLDPNNPDNIVDAYLTLGESLTAGGTLAEKLVERFNIASEGSGKDRAKADLDFKFGTESIAQAKHKADALRGVTANLTEIDDQGREILAKAVRDLMKYPFMTWGYQAGFKAISNTMAGSLIEGIVDQIMTYNNGDNSDQKKAQDKAIAKYVATLQMGTVEAVREELRTKTYNSVGSQSVNGSFEAQVRKHVLGVYGDAVKEVMEGKFQGIMEANQAVTETAHMMFEVFNKTYKEHTAEGTLTGSELTKLVTEDLWHVFPVIQGPLSVDHTNHTDYMPTVKTATGVAKANKFGTVQTHIGKGTQEITDSTTGKVTTVDKRDVFTNPKRTTLAEPGVGVGVGQTHSTDGAGTVSNMLKFDLLQVFDAYVLGVGQSEAISDANKDFAETNMRSDWTQLKAVEEGLARLITNLETKLGTKEADVYLKQVHDSMVSAEVSRQVENYPDTYSSNPRNMAKLIEKVLETVVPPRAQLAKIRQLREANDKRREVLAEMDLDVQQFVHSKATGYSHKGMKKPTMTNTYDSLDVDEEIGTSFADQFLQSKKYKAFVKLVEKEADISKYTEIMDRKPQTGDLMARINEAYYAAQVPETNTSEFNNSNVAKEISKGFTKEKTAIMDEVIKKGCP